jgi:hypothetical protein
MGEALIVRKKFKGEEIKSTLFAIINVTYPADSICNCTNGTKLFTTDNNANGSYTFIIPEAGTWTIICSDPNIENKDINITSEGQIENIILGISKYTYFYNRGVQNVTWSWGGTKGTIGGDADIDSSNAYEVKFNAANMQFCPRKEYKAQAGLSRAYTTNLIDITNINTLYIVTSGGTGDTSCVDKFTVGTLTSHSIGSVLGVNEAASTLIPTSNGEITTSLDVSSLSGSYTIVIEHQNVLTYYPDLYVYEVYGE